MGQRGVFIVLEGIDGAGKTDASRRLAAFVREQGRQVVETAQTALPEEHWLRAKFHSYHGRNLVRMKRHEEAEKHLLQALPVLREVLGDGHEQTMRALETLVDLYGSWGKSDKAEEYRRLLESGKVPPKTWR